MVSTLAWWLEKAFSDELCDLIIKETRWEDEIEGGFNKGKETYYEHGKRKTKIVFEEINTIAGCILNSYMQYANVDSKWNFNVTYMQKAQLGRYEQGGHYDWHIDTMKPDEYGMQRKISAVLYLSDPKDYEGGELEIKGLDKPLGRLPKGSVVVFPSYMSHRVTPVTKGIRYSAVGWMMGPTFK